MTAPIVVEDLWEAYPRRTKTGWRRKGDPLWALRDLHFEVAAGEMLGVIGSNGSGKSTLLRVLSGVLRPSKGSVHVDAPVSSLLELSAGMHRDLTGRENIEVNAVVSGMSRKVVAERFDEIAEFAGLEPGTLDTPLKTWSAGMGLRIGFAVAVHLDPKVLLVDEVLAVGDEAFQRKCMAKVRELLDQGCAAVLVSHDLRLIREQCDRVLLLSAGEVIDEGPTAEVVDRYQSAADADHAEVLQDLAPWQVASSIKRRRRRG